MFFRATPEMIRTGDVLKNEEGDWTVQSCTRGSGAYRRDFKIAFAHSVLGVETHWYPESIELTIHRSI